MSDQTKDVCLQELERINKEIETVRHEVEQEQRRLSHYQTVQADSRNTAADLPVPKSETAGKSLDGGSCGLSSCTDLTKTHFQARKYVVDNSKPRTDLEYDPLSNFSAGLRSCSLSGKEQKVKNGQGLKRARNAGPGDQKKPVAYQAQLSRLPSPEPLDDLTEDGVLIIDIPASPDKKRAQYQKRLDSVAGKSLQDKEEELKEAKHTVPILLHSPPLHLAKAEVCKAASLPAAGGDVEENRIYSKCAENNNGPSNLYENRECESIPADGSVDLERESQKIAPLQVAETEVKKSPEPASPSAFTDLLVEKEENTFQFKLPDCELPHSVGKMNPLQPYDFPPKNSLFYTPPSANSDSQCRQHAKQDQTTEPPVQNRVDNQWFSMNVPSMLPHSQTASSTIPGQMQGKAAVNHAPPESCLELAERVSGRNRGQAPQNLSASALTNRAESSSASSEQLLEKAHHMVIVLDSSSDDAELNYSEMDLSDSDPMEECYRIFMEENEEKGNDEQPEASVSML